MKKLAVITVNYNNYGDTRAFIKSFSPKITNARIFIVDSSTEKESLDIPDFAEIITTDNKGYAHGLNTGLKRARSEGYTMFVFINNDVEVAEDFIEKTIKSIDGNPMSLIGGKIYYYPGFEFHKNRYKKSDLGKVLWYAGGIVDWKNALTLHKGVDFVDNGEHDVFQETEFVTGCLMCFDIKLIDRVGMMDESYFLYYEDADWSEKIKKAGLKLYYDPSIVIWHKNGQSTGGSGSDMHVRYQEKNRLKFGLRYAPLRTKIHLLFNYLFKR